MAGGRAGIGGPPTNDDETCSRATGPIWALEFGWKTLLPLLPALSQVGQLLVHALPATHMPNWAKVT